MNNYVAVVEDSVTGMYKFLSRLLQYLADFHFLIKVTLMLPKEPGPGLEPYERITLCELFVNFNTSTVEW